MPGRVAARDRERNIPRGALLSPPSGLVRLEGVAYPRLPPWAAFFRLFAAGSISAATFHIVRFGILSRRFSACLGCVARPGSDGWLGMRGERVVRFQCGLRFTISSF